MQYEDGARTGFRDYNIKDLQVLVRPSLPKRLRYVPQKDLVVEEDARRGDDPAVCEVDAVFRDCLHRRGRRDFALEDVVEVSGGIPERGGGMQRS